jgi:hypothetical protein
MAKKSKKTKQNTNRKALGFGVGMVGMGFTGGRDGSPLPQHAAKASRKRALKKNFKSDVAAANFRMRALEGKSTNKIPEQDQNNSLIQSKNKGNDVGPNIPKISYEILKHNRAYKNKKTDPESGPSANDKKAVGPVIATSTLEATRRKKLERSAQKLNISVDELNRRILAVKMDTST